MSCIHYIYIQRERERERESLQQCPFQEEEEEYQTTFSPSNFCNDTYTQQMCECYIYREKKKMRNIAIIHSTVIEKKERKRWKTTGGKRLHKSENNNREKRIGDLGFVAVADVDTKLWEFTGFIALLLGIVESEKSPSIFAKLRGPGTWKSRNRERDLIWLGPEDKKLGLGSWVWNRSNKNKNKMK